MGDAEVSATEKEKTMSNGVTADYAIEIAMENGDDTDKLGMEKHCHDGHPISSGASAEQQDSLDGARKSGDEAVQQASPEPLSSRPAPAEQQNGLPATESSLPSLSTASLSRTESQSTAATSDTQKLSMKGSIYFVVDALNHIKASPDAKRREKLMDSTEQALGEIKAKGDNQQIDPKVLFEPLRLATEANTESTILIALQCIGRLISYSYFSVPTREQQADSPSDSLIDQAIDTICDCFDGESTSDKIQLQIIQSLLSAVLNDKVIVHGAGLLKAVRQMYNIFLHSKTTRGQEIAQGTLTQMVGAVFERARARLAQKEARLNLFKASLGSGLGISGDIVNGNSADVHKLANVVDEDRELATMAQTIEETSNVPVEKDGGPKITLQTFEKRGSFDEERLKEGPTMVTQLANRQPLPTTVNEHGPSAQNHFGEEDDEDEVYMKDAFLVFRAMCKISIKPLRPDEIVDLKSQGMRAKLLSLHIIHTVLFNNISLFLSPLATIKSSSSNEATPFTQAVKQLLCQSLSRNGASSVKRVFEVGCEIFWMMFKYLRITLKKEVEVFLKEIYLYILDNRNAPSFQKQCFLNVLERLSADPRALVEVYLNYDCDRTASDNMFQRIIEHLSRMSTTPVTITSVQQHSYQVHQSKNISLADWQVRGTVPRSLSTIAMVSNIEQDPTYPMDYAMKQHSLECIVQTLRSLVYWAQQSIQVINPTILDPESRSSVEEFRDSVETRGLLSMPSPFIMGTETPPPNTPLTEDDPSQLEKIKHRKTALLNAIRQFNFKPKRGIKMLQEGGFIESDSPDDIARFLLSDDRLDKAALGEYLGEGDQTNVAIMHAFVDAMDFTKTRFVDALRTFLQSFRLPGEAQKIDRFMLKFAERYITGNPNAFANADTAYVLAYSVIMLNTDQHSSKLRGKRMDPEDFIKNNRGINDNADLPDDYLRGIFDQIAHNEIVLNTEREKEANLGVVSHTPGGFAASFGQAFAAVGRDLQREAYYQKSEEMAHKTEQLFKSLLRAQRRSTSVAPQSIFIPATSTKHVGPMFEVTWMPFLTALSGCAQDTSNLETVKLCMDGLKLAIQISCLFDLKNPRMAFVACIARFTNLYNLSEMKAKNVEALKILLDVAHTEGNALKESWRDILTCVSQLDRFQLIAEGVPERTVPDVLKAPAARTKPPRSVATRNALQAADRTRSKSAINQANYLSEVAEESKSAGIINGVDRIFTGTSRLSGDAIVYFVKALTQVSWQEIQSSGQSQDPRTYSLQKLVEVSEYNMNRVRFEWSNIWQVLGDHFNQLSIRFLDLEELPGFKFQKDFLKPFEHIMSNAVVVQVKEIVLHSLIQMIQARGENIRSGWRTIFGVFTVAARERFEGVVSLAYENVTQIYNNRLGIIISQGAFADLIVCLTEFSKNARFQKKSLQAIEALRAIVPKMLKTPECPLSTRSSSAPKQPSRQSQEEQFWFPVLFAFHDVLMTGEDLEVRSRALNYLFDTLIKYGKEFPRDFWDTIWRQLLYPIFMVLKSKSEMSRIVNHEELSVWLSTTMIQALRNMMSLFTHYFEALEYMLDRFLGLLALCICQENDTLARIGSNCLQTLILQNVNKFAPQHWTQIVSAFVDLFSRTEAAALFSAATSTYGSSPSVAALATPPTPREPSQTVGDLQLSDQPSDRTISHNSNGSPAQVQALRSASSQSVMSNGDSGSGAASGKSSPMQSQPPTPGLEDYRPELQLQQAPVVVTAARRRFFNQIITKCVLQLLMIETLLRLMALLKKSYHFAKKFNDDLTLRNRLFQEGFMKQPPNLLKQESGSASVYVNILFRMYHDEGEERKNSREQTEAALIPLCVDIIDSYLLLKEETQQRNIVTWRPVVIDVIEGYANFPHEEFEKHAGTFAPLLTALMSREMGMELQRVVQALLHRILELHYEMTPLELRPAPIPTSPLRATVFESRRTSRVSSGRA